jgi:putative NADPH-quinone reductase
MDVKGRYDAHFLEVTLCIYKTGLSKDTICTANMGEKAIFQKKIHFFLQRIFLPPLKFWNHFCDMQISLPSFFVRLQSRGKNVQQFFETF